MYLFITHTFDLASDMAILFSLRIYMDVSESDAEY